MTAQLAADVADTAPAKAGARHRGAGRGRFAPLDGIRAFAVALVVAFHSGLPWAPGGLFGVDIFFVLSGYLITGLLLSEHAKTGGIRFGAFWARRALRLLPAMLIMVSTTLLVWRLTQPPSEIAGLRRDAVATLTYVANWHFSFAGQGYFAQGAAPSPMLHMWSLAVEEQFYLLWPLIVVLVLRGRTTDQGRRLLCGVSVAGAVASGLLMAVLAGAGVGASRLYYGTDTRAGTLLVGAALATILPLSGRVRRDEGAGGSGAAGRRSSMVLDAAGVCAAVALGWILTHIDGQAGWLYRGGFLLIAVLAATVVAGTVAAPRGVLARFLSLPPLRALGRISYGVYLWHWPVILYLTHARTGYAGNPLLALRLAVTVTLAALSWTLVEQPLQRAFGAHARTHRRARTNWAATGVLAGLLAVAIALASVPPQAGSEQTNVAGSAFSGMDAQPGTSFGTTSGLAVPQAARQPATVATPPPAAPRIIGDRPVRVDLVGDSQAYAIWSGMKNLQVPATFNIQLDGVGLFACGVEGNSPYKNMGKTVSNDFVPGGLGDCSRWQQSWQQNIDVVDPDVVVMILGRWEMVDRLWHGQWHNISDGSGYANWVLGQLESGLRTLRSKGAKVAVLETPCYQEEQPDGSPYPEVSASRLARFHQLQRELVASAGPDVQLVSADSLLCPAGKYATYDPQGRQIRNADGIHVVDQGGAEVADLLLPSLLDWAKHGTVPSAPSS